MNLPSQRCRIQNGGGGTTLRHLAPLLPGIQFEVMCSRTISVFHMHLSLKSQQAFGWKNLMLATVCSALLL